MEQINSEVNMSTILIPNLITWSNIWSTPHLCTIGDKDFFLTLLLSSDNKLVKYIFSIAEQNPRLPVGNKYAFLDMNIILTLRIDYLVIYSKYVFGTALMSKNRVLF